MDRAIALGQIKETKTKRSRASEVPTLRSPAQFCALLLAEGRSLLEIAGQLSHSPFMTLNVYEHVIDELEGSERICA